jgi:argininosuccinate lyase
MVRQLLAEGRDFSSLTLSEWRGFHELFDESIQHTVNAEASVRARRTPQSTHPDAVAAALKDARTWLRSRAGRVVSNT